jgi:hypothetical protein
MLFFFFIKKRKEKEQASNVIGDYRQALTPGQGGFYTSKYFISIL